MTDITLQFKSEKALALLCQNVVSVIRNIGSVFN